MLGATPIASEAEEQACLDHAARTARLAGLSGEHANTGLRAYYFGMAGLGWFIHPAVFAAAVTVVILVLYRREYHSRALRIISPGPIGQPCHDARMARNRTGGGGRHAYPSSLH